jgi:hypothetical protein
MNLFKASNIDDVILYHTKFLDTCLRDCIITSKSFHNIQQIMGICTMFSQFMQALTKNTKTKEELTKMNSKTDAKLAREKRKAAMQVCTFYNTVKSSVGYCQSSLSIY